MLLADVSMLSSGGMAGLVKRPHRSVAVSMDVAA
jgi:hypothetical protein